MRDGLEELEKLVGLPGRQLEELEGRQAGAEGDLDDAHELEVGELEHGAVVELRASLADLVGELAGHRPQGRRLARPPRLPLVVEESADLASRGAPVLV